MPKILKSLLIILLAAGLTWMEVFFVELLFKSNAQNIMVEWRRILWAVVLGLPFIVIWCILQAFGIKLPKIQRR